MGSKRSWWPRTRRTERCRTPPRGCRRGSPGWPVKLDGAIQSTLPLIGPGQNPAIAKIGGQETIVASTTGSATIEEYDAGGTQVRAVQQGAYGPGSNATDRSGTINLFESAVLGRLSPGSP